MSCAGGVIIVLDRDDFIRRRSNRRSSGVKLGVLWAVGRGGGRDGAGGTCGA